MLTALAHINALDLLSDELSSWTKPEVDTAYRLQAEAQRPVVDVPCGPQQRSAKVITLVSRLRTQFPHRHRSPEEIRDQLGQTSLGEIYELFAQESPELHGITPNNPGPRFVPRGFSRAA